MLQEIHHRVANNNAIISSILSLQIKSSASNEVQLVLKNVLARIRGINELYTNLLYSNEKLYVWIDKYFDGLISSFKSAFDVKSKFEIHMSADRIEVLSSKAVTIGIIVNELLTNVYKYAFKENEKGIVSVSIVKKEENVCLIVSDDGRGIENKKLEKGKFGFGISTIKMLAEEQLEGVLNIYNNNGTHVEISFSLN
jgi:two-component sensor histidine kinase